MDTPAFLSFLRKQIDQIGSQAKAAETWKISTSYLSDILQSKRNPGEDFLGRIGFERIVKISYNRKKEALNGESPKSSR